MNVQSTQAVAGRTANSITEIHFAELMEAIRKFNAIDGKRLYEQAVKLYATLCMDVNSPYVKVLVSSDVYTLMTAHTLDLPDYIMCSAILPRNCMYAINTKALEV